ncbi:MAG: 3-methyl-2-oxobutanoate hydroxymethyltransferase [Solirubrobacterales bacterium]
MTASDVSLGSAGVERLQRLKASGEKIVMVTAYDTEAARLAEQADVDLVLVGDSAAMTIYGYSSTSELDIEELLPLTAAVARGLKETLLVGDLPYGTYEISDEQAVATARRFVSEGGAGAIKLERGVPSCVERARAIVAAGIPVMGHVGLTPQSVDEADGFKARGRTIPDALDVAAQALALQEAGCFAIVFEAIPAVLAEALMPRMRIPVIGIGAGGSTDGQLLIWHDLLGLSTGHAPRFVKQYGNLREASLRALNEFSLDVRSAAFPAEEHAYTFPEEETDALLSQLQAFG